MNKATLLLILLTNFACFAQQWEWAKTVSFNLPININDANVRIAAEKNGNFYLSFYHWDSNNGEPAGSAIAQLDSNGNLLWQKVYTSKIRINDLATDDAGSLYITGDFKDTVSVDNTTLVSSGYNDAFLIKFDHSGVLQWSQTNGGPFNDAGSGLCVNSNGDFFVTGSYGDSASISANYIYQMSSRYTIAKYDTEGQTLFFKKISGGDSTSTQMQYAGRQVAMDASGNLLILGDYSAPPYGANFMAKLDGSGNVQWWKGVTGFTDRYRDFYVDGNGIFTTGDGSWTNGSWTITDKLDFSGAIAWHKSCPLNCGYYSDGRLRTLVSSNSGLLAMGVSGCRGLLIVTYAPDGTQLNIDTVQAFDIVEPLIMRKSTAHSYVVAGVLQGGIKLGPDSIYSVSAKIFIAKFSESSYPTTVTAMTVPGLSDVFPNPSSGILCLDLSMAREETEVNVRNILGESVCRKRCTAGKHQLDLSAHPKGLYLVDMTINGQSVSKKILLQ